MHVKKNVNLHEDAHTNNKVKANLHCTPREIAFPADNAKFIAY